MPVLTLWFYDPSGDKEGYLNHFVAKLDGPYCHCELQFPNMMSCSIYMGTKVKLKQRTFDKAAYTKVLVYCSDEQLNKAYRFACEEAHKGTGFSTLAMGMTLIPSLMPYKGNGTFCSKLCADILKAGNLLEESYSCDKLSPSALHRMFATTTCEGVAKKAVNGSVTPIDFK